MVASPTTHEPRRAPPSKDAMVGLDRWREILEIMWRRKLRALLTALSVSGGSFMLVILLGAGRGLSNGVESEFQRDATNAVWMNPGMMSKAYAGKPVGKRVRFYMDDFRTTNNIANPDHASAAAKVPSAISVTRGKR